MTIAKLMTEKLQRFGMWPDGALAVIERAKGHTLLESMARRWDEDTTCYPSATLAVVWISIKAIALEWIDENEPEAFYRSCFVKQEPADADPPGAAELNA